MSILLLIKVRVSIICLLFILYIIFNVLTCIIVQNKFGNSDTWEELPNEIENKNSLGIIRIKRGSQLTIEGRVKRRI